MKITNKKQDIYIDFDGTLVDTVKCIVDLYNEDFCEYEEFKKIDDTQIDTWDFDELNLTTREYINNYFNQPRFFKKIEFFNDSLWKLEIINKYFNINIISMGNKPNLKLKEKFIKDKLPYCNFIGVDFKEYKDKKHIDMSNSYALIDDNIDILLTSNAPRKICFGEEKGWNREWDGERLIYWYDFDKMVINNE